MLCDSAMGEGEQKKRLLPLRATSTAKLLVQPYNLREYLQRAGYQEELGYPDLAAGDAYRALLLTDEVEFGEFQEPVRKSLWSNRNERDNIGTRNDEASNEARAWVKATAKNSATEAYIILTRALAACGDLRNAFDFAKRGLKATPRENTLQKLHDHILESRGEKNLGEDVTWHQRVFEPKTELPGNGYVRREIYAWNDHEPDRYSEESIEFLNEEIRKCSTNCEILAVELPLLKNDKEHVSKLQSRSKGSRTPMIRQLGIFASQDIAPDEAILLEPSILAVNNRLSGSLCDACSAPLPSISSASPLPTCAECDDIYFCSESCLERAQQMYHPAICGIEDFDIVARDPSPAAATDALYVLLLTRVIAMAETQDTHPLDLPQTKYLWGDFAPLAASKERKLPFNFQTNIAHPIHILTQMGLDPFAPTTINRYDTWVLNTLFAKFRGVASAKMNPHILRPDVAAVHPLWCMANHSCAPNARWEWGAEDSMERQKGAMGLVARGGQDIVQWGDKCREGGIKKGEEVLNHYCDIALDVKERREWAAGALGGICQCERCIWEETEETGKDVKAEKDAPDGNAMDDFQKDEVRLDNLKIEDWES
ncbi:MAG: hypothetical protein Q9163_001418 [Psora crenata]